MEDIVLIEYLRNKGVLNEHTYTELVTKVSKPHSHEYHSYPHNHESEKYSEFFDNFKHVTKDMSEEEKHIFVDTLKDYGKDVDDHFNESYAKYVVSNMYHYDNGRKYIGEMFDMAKTMEVCERYRGLIPQNVTHADIYVAINAQYHDYCSLFKTWFNDGIEHKIIESAIIFWFKDDDYNRGFKLWNYFKED